MSIHEEYYKKRIEGFKSKGIYRELKDYNCPNDKIDFSSNDYLLLSKDEDLKAFAAKTFIAEGIGSSGSRLLSGNKEIFSEIENKIAKDKNTESAMIFNSGFQANISVLPAITEFFPGTEAPIVFSDFLNHASINYGLKLCRADVVKYNHTIDHLVKRLEVYKHSDRRKFIVTETVFSMSGDLIDLPAFIDIANKYNALLYLDEAHATGVLGKNGYGLSASCKDLKDIANIVVGTFSKALGCFGAYVACSETLKSYLINRCAGFIYSTSLPPAMVQVLKMSWEKIGSMNEERLSLLKNSSLLRENLRSLGLKVCGEGTNIVPIFFNGDVVSLGKFFAKNGFLVNAIRPPTVPSGKQCLRLSVNIGHTEENIFKFVYFVKNNLNMFY